MPTPQAGVSPVGAHQGPSPSGSSYPHPGVVYYPANGFPQGVMPAPYAPFTVQCGKCNTILADSFNQRTGPHSDPSTITLDEPIEDALVEARLLPSARSSRQAEPRNEPDGQDTLGWFYKMACADCESIVARFYATGTPAMSRLLNGRVSFERALVKIHQLGSRRSNEEYGRRLGLPMPLPAPGQARVPSVHFANAPPAHGNAPAYPTFTPPPTQGNIAAPSSNFNAMEFDKLRSVVMKMSDKLESMSHRVDRVESSGPPQEQLQSSPLQQNRSLPVSDDDHNTSSSSVAASPRRQPPPGKQPASVPARFRQSSVHDYRSSSEVQEVAWKRRRIDKPQAGRLSQTSRVADSDTLERREEEDVDSSIVTAETAAQAQVNPSTAEEAPVKKKRGRPPKKRPTDATAPTTTATRAPAPESAPAEVTEHFPPRIIKRGPGRPRKYPRPSDVTAVSGQQANATPAVSQAAATLVTSSQSQPRLQPSVEVPAVSSSRGRGRPSLP